MADKVEICICEKCGNEAEMTIASKWIILKPSGEIRMKRERTWKCQVCGNETDMLIVFETSQSLKVTQGT